MTCWFPVSSCRGDDNQTLKSNPAFKPRCCDSFQLLPADSLAAKLRSAVEEHHVILILGASLSALHFAIATATIFSDPALASLVSDTIGARCSATAIARKADNIAARNVCYIFAEQAFIILYVASKITRFIDNSSKVRCTLLRIMRARIPIQRPTCHMSCLDQSYFLLKSLYSVHLPKSYTLHDLLLLLLLYTRFPLSHNRSIQKRSRKSGSRLFGYLLYVYSTWLFPRSATHLQLKEAHHISYIWSRYL